METPDPSGNYLARHWRGELPLGVSFWLNGVLATAAMIAMAAALGAWAAKSQSNYSVPAVWIAYWTGAVAIGLWQWVGVWRSANHHVAQTGRRFWSGAAKLTAGLGAIFVVIQLVGTGIPGIVKGFEQADWLNKNGTWQFRVLNNGTELEISGGIGHGFAAELEKSLHAAPSVKVVHVNLGSGGLIAEATHASNAIRRRHLATYVSSTCVSACTIVFLGGTQRFVRQGAKLGFHSPSIPGLSQNEMAGELAKHRSLLIAAGVSPTFASHVTRTLPADMWFPSGEELVAQGVASALTQGDEFAISGLGKHLPDRSDVARNLGEVRVFKATRVRDPALFEKLVDIEYAALRTGRSIDDVRGDTLPLIVKLYGESLPYSNREALVRSARLMASEFGELQSAPGRTCLNYALKSDPAAANVAVRYFSDATKREEQEAIADAIESSDTRRTVPKLDDLQPQLAEVVRIVESKIGDDIQLLGQLAEPGIDASRACRALKAYFEAITSLPQGDSERLLRAVFGAR